MTPFLKIALLTGGFVAMAVPFDCFAGEIDLLPAGHGKGRRVYTNKLEGSIPPSRITRNDDGKRGGRTAGSVRTHRGGSGSGGNQGGGQGSGQGGSGK